MSNLGIILVILLILCLVGAIPTFGLAMGGGPVGLILLIVLILILTGRL